MDTPDTSAADIDLGGAPAEDPFAEENLPPDPLADGELPPGVEQGSLAGDNPSEEPEEEVVPDEERDASQDEDEEPVAAVEEPEPPTSPPADEPDPIAAEADEPDEPETPVAESEDGEASALEPEPPKPPSKPKSRKKAAKATGKSITRGYVILRPGAEPGEWVEAFERPDPNEEAPFMVEARNSESAKRKAYRLLSEDLEGPQEYVLNPIPEKLWKPTRVSGRVHKQVAITVGD